MAKENIVDVLGGAWVDGVLVVNTVDTGIFAADWRRLLEKTVNIKHTAEGGATSVFKARVVGTQIATDAGCGIDGCNCSRVAVRLRKEV